MRQIVQSWIKSGSDPIEGLSLLRKAGGSPFLIRFVSIDPFKYQKLIADSLNQLVSHLKEESKAIPIQRTKTESDRKTSKLIRDEFPFLLQPDCPVELKVLITDKFNTFHQFSKLHTTLIDCVSLDQCAKTSASIIDNYIENRMIYAELDYYKATKTVLGKHPIFKEFNRLQDYRKQTEKDLYILKRRIEHNIWRIESEIEKGDKPHLDVERRIRLENRRAQWADIDRLLQ